MRLCVGCKRPVDDPGTKRCRGCYRALSTPSPLREWRARTGKSLEALAVETGLGRRTVQRVASGQHASRAVALKLAQATGLDAVALIRGTRWT